MVFIPACAQFISHCISQEDRSDELLHLNPPFYWMLLLSFVVRILHTVPVEYCLHPEAGADFRLQHALEIAALSIIVTVYCTGQNVCVVLVCSCVFWG